MALSSPGFPNRLETTRLMIRAYAAGDGPMYFEVGQKNRDHLQRYESGNIILNAGSPAESEQSIAEICRAWQEGAFYFLGAFDRANGEFVAQIYIGVVSHVLPEYEVGYFVDRDHEGQGYVSEALRAVLGRIFHDLGAHRISLRCSDTNLRSVRVAEHCGFTLEGHLRENQRDPQGGYSGDYIFGLLRSEFIFRALR